MSQRSREEYLAYIKSHKWKAKKKAFYKVYKRKCQGCSSLSDIHVHHRTYIRFGNEHLEDLRAVCSTCHNAIHTLENQGYDLEVATDTILGVAPKLFKVGKTLAPRKRLKRKRRRIRRKS